jgi:hypothetical protein
LHFLRSKSQDSVAWLNAILTPRRGAAIPAVR